MLKVGINLLWCLQNGHDGLYEKGQAECHAALARKNPLLAPMNDQRYSSCSHPENIRLDLLKRMMCF